MKKFRKISAAMAIAVIIILSGSCSHNGDTCQTPATLLALRTHTTDASLKWTAANGAPYTIQYRVVGATVWQSMANLADTIYLSSLTPASNYEWQVKSACATSYSTPATFATTSCDRGYEGADCSTEIRGSYLGRYSLTGSDDRTPQSTYSAQDMLVAAVSTDILKVHFNSFNLNLDYTASLSSDGHTYTVDPYTSGAYTYSGSGTLTTSGNSTTFTLTLTEVGGTPSTTTVYHFTGVKF